MSTDFDQDYSENSSPLLIIFFDDLSSEFLQLAAGSISYQRAKLGAYQNRLEHTIENLGVGNENVTAAESRIRDADMAKQMMNFTKAQILMQTGTAMLAQANTTLQQVLQSFR